MFIQNHNGNAIINTDHIRRVDLCAPQFEQRDFVVSATLTYGTLILYRGAEESCRSYMEKFLAAANER